MNFLKISHFLPGKNIPNASNIFLIFRLSNIYLYNKTLRSCPANSTASASPSAVVRALFRAVHAPIAPQICAFLPAQSEQRPPSPLTKKIEQIFVTKYKKLLKNIAKIKKL